MSGWIRSQLRSLICRLRFGPGRPCDLCGARIRRKGAADTGPRALPLHPFVCDDCNAMYMEIHTDIANARRKMEKTP